MDNMSADSRVWIYQSNRAISGDESASIQANLNNFCEQWASHSRQLKASGQIVKDHFVVLMADESQAGASGCSIDSSVHFIKTLQQQYNLNLFDRMTFAYESEKGLQLAERSEFEKLYKEGSINDQTLVYDTLVKTKADFENEFQKPLSTSWHHRFV